MPVIVREMAFTDLTRVASIHRDCFPNDGDGLSESLEWIRAKFQGFPTNRYYVACDGTEILGYILWTEKGGLRKEAVLELEQIGVHSSFRGRTVGATLIDSTLGAVLEDLEEQGRRLKLVEVTTGTSNEAQRLYVATLGASVVATIPSLFDDDEVIMLARAPDVLRVRSARGHH